MSAISAGQQKLDLYDFFSVLLPGTAFLLSIAPFLPESVDPLNPAMLVILLLGGFIVGRGIHVAAVFIEDDWETIPTHREKFEEELSSPKILNDETVSRFKEGCMEAFDIDDLSQYLKDEDGSYSRGDLYVLVRSAIHFNGRGRSRTFQALYSFYRSMWVVTSIIGLIYYVYALGKSNNIPDAITGYTSHVGAMNLDPVLLGLGGAVLFSLAHVFFRGSRKDYQKYYIQYLLADFLIIRSFGTGSNDEQSPNE